MCGFSRWIRGRGVKSTDAINNLSFVSVQIVMLTVLYLEVYYSCNDAYTNIDALMLISCGTLALMKITCFRIYADNLIRNYISAVRDYLAIDTEEKRAVMRRHAFMGRIICYIVIFFSYFGSAVFILVSMMARDDLRVNKSVEDRAPGYPIPSSCTLAHFHISTGLYFVIFVVQCILLAITCTGNLGCDSLFLHITLHVCGQLKILKSYFASFDVTSPRVSERFNMLIMRHDHLITMASKLAEAISFVLLVQLFISCILICVLGFQFIIAMKTSDFGILSKSTIVLTAILAQLTVYSIIGDHLKTQMEEVGLSVYQSEWYDLPTKVTKNMVLIMMWNQFPMKLQAGNFIAVDLGTYMNILKTSLSYLSVLRVMVEV